MKQLELRIDWARTDDHIVVESLNGKIIRFHEDKLKQFLRVVKIYLIRMFITVLISLKNNNTLKDV